MDNQNYHNPLLAMLESPAFFVKDGIVLQANRAAEQRLITPGLSIEPLLGPSADVYHAFQDGCLYLTLQMIGGQCGATVTKADGFDLFRLASDGQFDQILALAAQQLRKPLQSLFVEADANPQNKALQQSLYQLHHIITNMADFPRYHNRGDLHLECTELTSFIFEIVEKSSSLLSQAGIRLHFAALPECIFVNIDREMFERAIFNLISNAAKFSPSKASIDIKLTRSSSTVYFSIHNPGEAIAPAVLKNIFTSYLRYPGIEDGRRGLGLGMALVQIASASHGGAVLIDTPEAGGTRVTLTIPLNFQDELELRSPIMLPSCDYASGKDHGLLELCEVLPSKLYQS